MSDSKVNQKKLKPKEPKIEELLARTKSLILGTVGDNGRPLSSYAPYVYLDKSFQILVSYMAKHTLNLKNNQYASVMLIQDESEVNQIYARERLTLDCEVNLVDSSEDLYKNAIKALEEKHGSVVKVLSELNDFVMFNLKPVAGNYVNGFASAYEVTPELEIIHQVKGAHGKHNHDDNND